VAERPRGETAMPVRPKGRRGDDADISAPDTLNDLIVNSLKN